MNSHNQALLHACISVFVTASVYTLLRLTQSFFLFSDFFLYFFCAIFSLFFIFHFAQLINKPLFDSKKSLDTYIKNTLHELNVPTSTIQANLDLMLCSITDEKNLKRLKRIQTANTNLQELYEELEYLLKKESGKIESEIFDAKELVRDIVNKFELTKKSITITTKLEPLLIRCDKKGFGKVIENLLSNAIKFNRPQGFVSIMIHNQELIVEDNGIGIEHANLFAIFERYYQENSHIFGHGIGLSIVKEYCDANKIEIKIDSKKDNGTKFTLLLHPLTIN